MSSDSVPAFDALDGVSAPFSGFGEILQNWRELLDVLRRTAIETRQRMREGFGYELEEPSRIPEELDAIVDGMWDAGWDPKTGNINLFVCDFGVVLSVAVLDRLGGEPVFRSTQDMADFSIFWADKKFEAFPFHKVLKCLYEREGESISGFVKGVSSRVQKQVAKLEGDTWV